MLTTTETAAFEATITTAAAATTTTADRFIVIGYVGLLLRGVRLPLIGGASC